VESEEQLHLISQWFIRPGKKDAVLKAVEKLAREVMANEPGTLAYLVHAPTAPEQAPQSLPPSDEDSLMFFECYRNRQAFEAHVNGKTFTDFVKHQGQLFVPDARGQPYTTVMFLRQHAGFCRPVAQEASAAHAHPGVMVEVMAKNQDASKAFYHRVFGWEFEKGAQGFAYVHFPSTFQPPLLAGIGQADPRTPGMEQGCNFYLLTKDLGASIALAEESGGKSLMSPTRADGYHFAMIRDPEGNAVGLVEPFAR